MNRNVYVILALFLAVYLILTFYRPGGLLAYVVPSLCWIAVALTTLILVGMETIRTWMNTRIVLMALLVAVFQIFLLVDAGLINKFGKSPMSFTPTGIAINLMLVSSTLLGMELSRGYLARNLSRKRPALTLTVITLLYTFASASIFALLNFQNPLIYSKFMGETFLPTLTANLLATYLAMLSGPIASLAYRAPLQAFWWFSPILPDIPWGYKSLIGVMSPTIGFVAINMATTRSDMIKAGIRAKRESTIRTRKAYKSLKGWLAISVFLVLAVWMSTGLLGFYPTVVGSGSMQPTLNVGDVAIVIQTKPSQIKVGDIIQYWQDDPDPVFPNQIRGKLIYTIPKLGWISITLKNIAAEAYTFLLNLPGTVLNAITWLTARGIYIASALVLAAYSYLLITFKNVRGRKR